MRVCVNHLQVVVTRTKMMVWNATRIQRMRNMYRATFRRVLPMSTVCCVVPTADSMTPVMPTPTAAANMIRKIGRLRVIREIGPFGRGASESKPL